MSQENGCIEQHVVEVFDRGGTVTVDAFTALSQISWGRKRDDISEASVYLNARQCVEQEDLLGKLRSMRHEIVIWRGSKRVWEGPITRRAGTRSGFQFFAKDVMQYAGRSVMRSAYDNRGTKAGKALDRAELILFNELDRLENPGFATVPPINVVPHIVVHDSVDSAGTAAFTAPYQFEAFEHIDSLAARGGIDYTVVGRAIHLWDTHEALGRLETAATQADFRGELVVTEYGMELATHAYVTDGQGNYGVAGAEDPYYGTIELLSTAYDESEGGDPPTSAELDSQAQRNRSGRLPAPVEVRVPDGSSIDPSGVLNIDVLVPGVWIPVRAEVYGFKLTQMQKLQSMKVTETPAGEDIAVTLTPASINDAVAED